MPAVSRSKIRLIRSLIILMVLVIISTVGFYLLGIDKERTLIEALHITANIFSTVGAWREPFDDADRIWEIIMIVVGIGAAMYAFGSVMALLTSGDIQRVLGRRQLTGKIRTLENHYIVCGFGRMGQGLAQSLSRENQPFVVIDLDSEVTAIAEEKGYMYLLGDASDELIMKLAGIHQARGLVACLSHDADNVFVTLTARGLNQNLQIIARSEQQQTEQRLLKAGADRVVCPAIIGAVKATRMLLHPAVEDLLDATTSGDLGFDKIRVAELPSAIGKTLAELELPTRFGLMILAVIQDNGKKLFNPSASHTLTEEEELIIIGPRSSVDDLIKSTSQ